MVKKIKTVRTIVYTYEVEDNYGNISGFDDKKKALDYLKYVKAERKVLDLIKPSGVTLIVSKDKNVFYKCIPAFIGFCGVPFCEANKDKEREFYYNGINSVERYSSIYGNLIKVLKQSFKLMHEKCMSSYDYHDGAYRYHWDTIHGNSACAFICHPNHWTKGALWYHWDGKEFSTNDRKCKITKQDLIDSYDLRGEIEYCLKHGYTFEEARREWDI